MSSKLAPGSKVRVHVQESVGSNEVFRITEAKLLDALQNHPDLRTAVEFSFGSTPDEFDAKLATSEALLAGTFNPHNLRERAPNLRWVQSIFAGMDKLAPEIPDGIVLTNASGVHAPKAAEYTIGALIMLNSGFLRFLENQRTAKWEQIFAPSLSGRTLLLLGTGALGSAIANRAKQFGMRVLGVARQAVDRPDIDVCFAANDLHRALPQADFVVITLPNTTETRGLIGRKELDFLPKHAGIVSIGRAQVLDHAALIDKLNKKELAGAFLDVFEQEPLPQDSPLWHSPRIVISPHCAVDDPHNHVRRCLDLFFDNLRRFIDGRELRNVVDLKLGY